jgi:hypothetical protein
LDNSGRYFQDEPRIAALAAANKRKRPGGKGAGDPRLNRPAMHLRARAAIQLAQLYSQILLRACALFRQMKLPVEADVVEHANVALEKCVAAAREKSPVPCRRSTIVRRFARQIPSRRVAGAYR